VNDSEHGISRSQDSFEQRAPFDKRRVSKVGTVEREQVEREHGDRGTRGAPEPAASGIEVTPTGFVDDHQFGVENDVFNVETEERGDNLGDVPLDEVAASGPDLAFVGGLPEEDTLPVDLGLVCPAGARGERLRR
jgi:hypothetical protein